MEDTNTQAAPLETIVVRFEVMLAEGAVWKVQGDLHLTLINCDTFPDATGFGEWSGYTSMRAASRDEAAQTLRAGFESFGDAVKIGSIH